jgi:hypothetical protein
MFSPLTFLGISVLWVVVVFAFIYRDVARLNREAREDERLFGDLETRLANRK